MEFLSVREGSVRPSRLHTYFKDCCAQPCLRCHRFIGMRHSNSLRATLIPPAFVLPHVHGSPERQLAHSDAGSLRAERSNPEAKAQSLSHLPLDCSVAALLAMTTR